VQEEGGGIREEMRERILMRKAILSLLGVETTQRRSKGEIAEEGKREQKEIL